MKIVIDGRLWDESGLGRYIRNLVINLEKIDSENQYYVFLLKKDFDKIDFSNPNFHKVLADFKWYGMSEQIQLPKILEFLNPDLVHFPHFNVPILHKGKFVVTIHDLIHQHFQTRETSTLNPFFHTIKKLGYKKIFSHAVNKSSKIIVPSEFVKDQLIKEWQVKKEKIIVTHEGVDQSMIDLIEKTTENDFNKITEKFDFKKPYLFYVGNAQPHKNLPRLISAFVKLKEKYPDLSLVLSGPDHHFWQQVKNTSKTHGLIFTGFVSEKELVTLYKNAEMFVMPSFEEGFGIPVLEAMACSCPVVSSIAGSLPEVGGDAAVYFNPKDEYDMFEKINSVIENGKLKKELIENGQKRFKEFKWKKLAIQTLEVYLSTQN